MEKKIDGNEINDISCFTFTKRRMIHENLDWQTQEKTAWICDISGYMDNVRSNDSLEYLRSDVSSVTMPEEYENDPKLFNDDVDIKFSRTLNSCRIPQVRSATRERLLQRLMDPRFLSIDYLNTFLTTHRLFIDSVTVIETLKKALYEAELAETPAGSLV